MKFRRFLLACTAAISFTLTTPAVAKADPISIIATAFVAALGEGAAIAVATFIVNTATTVAASFALNRVSQALSGKNKAALQERQASVIQLSLGEVPREFVFGVCATGGSLDDGFNWGGQHGTDYVTRCISLADHAIEALYEVIVDDVGYLFTGNGVQPGYGGALRVDFFNASAEGSPPPDYVIEASAGAWTVEDRHVGMAHVWVTYKADETIWTQGAPDFKFQLRGMRVYDPRKDAALGYTGPNPHVWEDRSTHEYDANAALVRYAFQRGIYVEGHQGDPEYLLLGRGLTADEAPPERIIAAANLCAEPITEGGGGANIRYKTGGVIRASDDFIAVEEMFAAAMAGVIVQREGGVEVEPGHAKAAVVTIADGDLVVGEPIGFSEFLPDTDGGRINTVIPRYISPAQNWRDHSGPVRRDLADIAEDGGPREATLPLALVYEGDQADRCAEIARRLARLERRATLVLPPDFAWLEEGDWIAWQSDLKHGGATVRYRIEGWSLDEQWRMRLSLREIASSVYGVPDPIEDTAEPPSPPVPVDALTLPGAAAQAIQLAGEVSIIPAVRFTWDTPVDGAVRAIRGEVRILGDTNAAPTRFEGDALADGVGIATNGVAAGQDLQARLVPIGDPTRPILPSAWFTISTTEITAGDTATWNGRTLADLEAMEARIRVALERLLALANDRTSGAIAEARQRTQTVRDTLDRLMILAEVDPVAGTAIVRGDVQVEGEDYALAQTFTLIRAATDDLEAVVALEQTARVDGDEASAELVAAAVVQAADDLAAAIITLEAYTDGVVFSATAGLATLVEVEAAIAAASLDLESYIDGEIATATASLATIAALDAAIAGVSLDLEAYVDGEIASATADLVTTAELEGAIAASALTLESYIDDEIVSATASLVTAVELDDAIAGAAVTANGYVVDYAAAAFATFATQASLAGLDAIVDATASSVVDLEAMTATARFDVVATASGGQPARLSVISDTLGSAVAFDASEIWFGENTFFQSATQTLRTTIGSLRYVQAWGPTFGADDLTYWQGPSSVSAGAETKANAIAWDDPYGGSFYGGETLSGPFDSGSPSSTIVDLSSSWANLLYAVKSTAAGGYILPRIDIEVSGDATPGEEGVRTYEIEWQLISVKSDFSQQETILTGVWSFNLAPGAPITFVATGAQTWDSYAVTQPGERRFYLQARFNPGSATTQASYRNARVRGFYAA